MKLRLAMYVCFMFVLIHSADNDFALNLLRYGEVRFMQGVLSTISRSTMASSRGRTAQSMASMLNYLVRNGYFAKQKDARLLIRQNVQRGMRKEIDEREGKTAHEILFGALLFHQLQDTQLYERPPEVLAITRVICDD